MKTNWFVIGISATLLTGCSDNEQREQRSQERYDQTATTSPRREATTNESAVAADNTAKNVRDRTGDTLTPGDQSETEADRGITQNIRKSLMADDSLSVTAKNIKIIAVNGVVTLRGPVNNEQEKAAIAEKAKAVAGVQNVVNQLEIKNTPP